MDDDCATRRGRHGGWRVAGPSRPPHREPASTSQADVRTDRGGLGKVTARNCAVGGTRRTAPSPVRSCSTWPLTPSRTPVRLGSSRSSSKAFANATLRKTGHTHTKAQHHKAEYALRAAAISGPGSIPGARRGDLVAHRSPMVLGARSAGDLSAGCSRTHRRDCPRYLRTDREPPRRATRSGDLTSTARTLGCGRTECWRRHGEPNTEPAICA